MTALIALKKSIEAVTNRIILYSIRFFIAIPSVKRGFHKLGSADHSGSVGKLSGCPQQYLDLESH